MSDKLKMWLVVRTDLAFTPSRFAILSGHAFSTTLFHASQKYEESYKEYMSGAAPKIVLRARSLKELTKATEKCEELGLPSYRVVDNSQREFPRRTPTMLAIGPCYEHQLPDCVWRMNRLSL